MAFNGLNNLKQMRIFCLNLLSFLMDTLGVMNLNLEVADSEDEAQQYADNTISQSSHLKLSLEAFSIFLLGAIGGHKCRCLTCGSTVQDSLVQETKELIESDSVAILTAIDLTKDIAA